jgi:hypothetical protein
MLDERYGTLAAEVEEDVADYRHLTAAQDDVVVRAAARSAMQILRSRPDFAQAMIEVDPPASDFEALMLRLMARRSA